MLLENCISFFDFDNTIYKGQSRYLILDFSVYLEANSAFHSEELQQLFSLFTTYQENKINRHDFAVQFIQTYYRGLTGREIIEIDEHARNFWNNLPEDSWFPFTFPLLHLIKDISLPILISGSPLEVLQRVKRKLGFYKIFASKGIVNNGEYTGIVYQEMATQAAKTRKVNELTKIHNFNPRSSFAFGDSSSDLPILKAVDPLNAYLLGAKAALKNEFGDEKWNLLDHDKKIVEHVQNRINALKI